MKMEANKKKLVVLSGAGVSQESGIKTFRDSGGMWEEYKIEDVATPRGWNKNPQLVTDFYNERRKQLLTCEPNEGHIGLSELEKDFDVYIITQNVDDLHERGGSSNVLHLHGELKKSRSIHDEKQIYPIDGWELKVGDRAKNGHLLRPHIVWFGEEVPAMSEAVEIIKNADILVVIGTSLNVYPAAGLIDLAPRLIPIFVVDPVRPTISSRDYYKKNIEFIEEKAGRGVELLTKKLQSLK